MWGGVLGSLTEPTGFTAAKQRPRGLSALTFPSVDPMCQMRQFLMVNQAQIPRKRWRREEKGGNWCLCEEGLPEWTWLGNLNDPAADSHNMQGTQKSADSSANDTGTTQLKHNPLTCVINLHSQLCLGNNTLPTVKRGGLIVTKV